MKRNQKNCLASLFLISLIAISCFTPIFDTSLLNIKHKSSFDNYPFDIAYDNYCYLADLNQTNYFFNAKGACYVLAEVNGTDFTSFQLDNETLEVSYGLNVFPKYFGANYTSHNLTFKQSDIDNKNFKWVTVEPLFIKEDEITVNLTSSYTLSFNASGLVAILMQPNFSLNWLYVEVDNVVINDIYNTSDYLEIDSTFYSYFVQDGAYLCFSLDMEPKEHSMKIMGNGSIKFKIIPNFDWDEDLLSDVEEVQQELFSPQLDPTIANVWGFFEKSSEFAYFPNSSGSSPGYFSLYIPETYSGLKYLYIQAKTGTISNIIVDEDDLTLRNLTLSTVNGFTPYGSLTSGHHAIQYEYIMNESTEISFHIDGEKVLLVEDISMKDTDADGVKDVHEIKSGLNPYDPDTDHDGLPDNVDSSPLATMTFDKDALQQIIIPHNSSKNTLINLQVKNPDPDYSLDKSRIFLKGHSCGTEGLEVLIYPVLRLFGNQSITRNGLTGWLDWGFQIPPNFESYSLVDGYDPTGFGDAIPHDNNSNAELTFIFGKQNGLVLEFDIWYPKGHPAKDDNAIDLRFDFRWFVVYNSSGSMNSSGGMKLLHHYKFEENITVQSLIVQEVGDVNYILASPDSMIENQILWAITQNPQIGTPSDYNVDDDIVGMGTVDYFELANQTLIDRNNTIRASNESEVLYVAGLQNNYDLLNKIKIQNIVNPSFELNHSGDLLFYFSFYSVSDVYNLNYTYENEQIRGDNKLCYYINWNNYSTGAYIQYSQRANFLSYPTDMQVKNFQNSTCLMLTEVFGSEIPFTALPFSNESLLHDKIIFRKQVYIERSEPNQNIPTVNFNSSQDCFKELIDNRRWSVEASELLFNNYTGFSTSQRLVGAYSDFKNVILSLDLYLNQIDDLSNQFDIWLTSPATTLLEIDNLITFLNSMEVQEFADFGPQQYDEETFTSLITDFFDVWALYDSLFGEYSDFKDLLNDIGAQRSRFKRLGMLWDIVGIVRTGFSFVENILETYNLIKDYAEGKYSGNEIVFIFRLTTSIALTAYDALFITFGVIKLISNIRPFYQNALVHMAKFVAKVVIIFAIIVEVSEFSMNLYESYQENGFSEEFWLDVAYFSTKSAFTFWIPLILIATGWTGVGLVIGIVAMVAFFVYENWDTIQLLAKEFAEDVGEAFKEGILPGLKAMGDKFIDFLTSARRKAEEVAPPPTVVIVWEEEEGHPGTTIEFFNTRYMRDGSLEVDEGLLVRMAFHNTGPKWIYFEIEFGLVKYDGSVDYTAFTGGWWFAPGEYHRFTWATEFDESTPNLTLSIHISQYYYYQSTQTFEELYNEIHNMPFGMPVLPCSIANFLALTEEIPEPTPPNNASAVCLNLSDLIELDPLVGNVSVNLPVISEGYNSSLVKCEISLNDTNFYVDTPNLTQSIDSDVTFNLFSQNPHYPGGIYYLNVDLKLNATDELILSREIPFKLLFVRNLSHSQTNILQRKEINKRFYSSNITTPINVPALNLSIGDILFIKLTPQCTKATYLNLYNSTELVKSHLIIPRGNRDFSQQLVEIFIDQNMTVNMLNFSCSMVDNEYLWIHELFFINASIDPPQNQYFTPINFTNNGNVPEYVKFTFSGVPFDAVDTSLHPDEFYEEYQLICVMPGEHRECAFNISKPVAISNLLSRSLTAINPLNNSIYTKYTDSFAIDEIYIDSPKNQTYKIYDRENNPGLWLNIIPEIDLIWSAYSLDGQSQVNFSKSASIPLPADGSHYLQVFGNDTLNISYQSERRYFTLESCLINITSPANNSLQLNLWTGIYNATYGFEEAHNGTKPAGWETSEDVQVLTYVDGHIKVVEMGKSDNALCREEFPQTHGTIEFWMKFKAEVIHNYYIYFEGKTDTLGYPEVLQLKLMGGYFYCTNDVGAQFGVPNIDPPQKNVWHHMRIDFRCTGAIPYLGLSEGYYVLTIDGVSSPELIHRRPEITQYDFFEISIHEYSSTTTKLWIDAVGFSWDPNYDVGDNFDEKAPYVIPLEYELPPHVINIQYSLNGQGINPLLGPDIISFNETGDNALQLFGSDIYGDVYESRINNFAISAVHFPLFAGSNVVISEDEYTGIFLNFTTVLLNGTISFSMVPVDSLPPLPSQFNLGYYNDPYNTTVLTLFCYNITVTSAMHNNVYLRIPYDEDNVKLSEKNLRLYRLNEFNSWQNVTWDFGIDTLNNFIYGRISNINSYQFAILEILDTHPPITRVYFNGTEGIMWHGFNGPITVNFTVLYDLTGLHEFYYSYNNINWTTYTGPFIIANECITYFYYTSVDVVGNAEIYENRYTLYLDWTPPTTTHSIETFLNRDGKIYVCALSDLTLETTDNFEAYPTIYYRFDDGAYSQYTHEIHLYSLSYGTHTVEYYAVDKLGNNESIQSFTITYISQREFSWKKIEPTIITIIIVASAIGLASVGIFLLIRKLR